MKRLLATLAVLVLTGCAQNPPAAEPAPQTAQSQAPAPAPAPASRTATVELGKSDYTLQLPEGAPDRVLYTSTPLGIVWVSPQVEEGKELGRRPVTAAKLYLTPHRSGGGDLAQGAVELFTFPLTVQKDGIDRYLTVIKILGSGEWVVTSTSLHALGVAQSSGRIDAVNVTTKAHRFVTDASWAGGNFFDWRAEGGRVYWEQRRSTKTGEVEVVESVKMDLDTGEKNNVPPGSAK